MTSCFVLIEKETLEVVGFYTLAATSVAANDLPAETIKRLPRYPTIPAALLGRLAVISRFHGKGLGGALLADAALRVLRSDTRAFALIVDAKDDAALAFYLRHGFLSLASRRMSMFLPVATILKGAAAG